MLDMVQNSHFSDEIEREATKFEQTPTFRMASLARVSHKKPLQACHSKVYAE